MSKKSRKLTRHHVVNKVDKLNYNPENIILLRNEKHSCWHEIFRNLTFLEAARLLIRADKILKAVKGV